MAYADAVTLLARSWRELQKLVMNLEEAKRLLMLAFLPKLNRVNKIGGNQKYSGGRRRKKNGREKAQKGKQ